MAISCYKTNTPKYQSGFSENDHKRQGFKVGPAATGYNIQGLMSN